MATKARTYRFTHDGREYTRTTRRTYTHAVLHYANTELVNRHDGTNLLKRIPCELSVREVAYCGSYALALKASTKWIPRVYCKSEVVELTQPS
jgi:hypothetical protein